MKKISKEKISVFGEDSIALIRYCRNNYVCMREKDGLILAIGKELKGYIDDIIRTMYTGEKYGTGDFILVGDIHGMICKFK